MSPCEAGTALALGREASLRENLSKHFMGPCCLVYLYGKKDSCGGEYTLRGEYAACKIIMVHSSLSPPIDRFYFQTCWQCFPNPIALLVSFHPCDMSFLITRELHFQTLWMVEGGLCCHPQPLPPQQRWPLRIVCLQCRQEV